MMIKNEQWNKFKLNEERSSESISKKDLGLYIFNHYSDGVFVLLINIKTFEEKIIQTYKKYIAARNRNKKIALYDPKNQFSFSFHHSDSEKHIEEMIDEVTNEEVMEWMDAILNGNEGDFYNLYVNGTEMEDEEYDEDDEDDEEEDDEEKEWFVNKKQIRDLNYELYHITEIENFLIGFINYIEPRSDGDCYDASEVAYSAIDEKYQGKGYGKFLYAMASISSNQGITCDRRSVSAAAERVWKSIKNETEKEDGNWSNQISEIEPYIGEFDDVYDPKTDPYDDDCKRKESKYFDDDKHLNIVASSNKTDEFREVIINLKRIKPFIDVIFGGDQDLITNKLQTFFRGIHHTS
ncbi:GNAT family N-acetyltransferase [Candidatus Pacearchaeota archaeon]|nr:GNAT family N-acetyltransferase [Candidatus Pacearchaeota archaeon]